MPAAKSKIKPKSRGAPKPKRRQVKQAKKAKQSKPTKQGKSPKPTKPRYRGPFWIGFDLGGTKMLATVLDKDYNELGSARKSTNGSEGQSKGRRRILNTIHDAIAEARVDSRNLQGIAIGCPGLVDPDKGSLLIAPNLGWRNMNLGKILRQEFGCHIAVLNDVDAGTYGEYIMGAGMGARSVLGVFPGTGVGAGFVYDGKLVMGRTISCMELGNIMLPGTHLGSAEFGAVILEDLTSRLALASTASVACYRGQADELDKKTGGNLRNIRSKALAASFRSGDESSMILFRNSIRYLGMGIGIVVNLFGPDRIVLGGGLVEELPNLYINLLREEINRYSIPELASGVKLSLARLGSRAVAIGAVAWLRARR